MARFTTSDGIGIEYRVWGEAAAGPPVLLHHGFIADASLNWEINGAIAALVAAGRRVVAHDARGHGRSDAPHDPAFYGESRMARDVSELADHLGLDAYDLAGYSMGGVTALLVAVDDRRLRRLVVGGIGARVIDATSLQARAAERTRLAELLEIEPPVDPATVDDAVNAEFLGFIDTLGVDRLAMAACARALHREPIPLDQIAAPTLVVAGEDDVLAPDPHVLADGMAEARVLLVPGDHTAVSLGPDLVDAIVSHLCSE